ANIVLSIAASVVGDDSGLEGAPIDTAQLSSCTCQTGLRFRKAGDNVFGFGEKGAFNTFIETQFMRSNLSMSGYKIIVNPVSGRGVGAQSVPQIESELQAHGLEYDLVMTDAPWHAAELAEKACLEGYEVVVAAGGDGTANEVLNGLMQANKKGGNQSAMGVLTVGRGNDFAYGAGIPLNLADGCAALAADKRQKIDVGYVVGGNYPEGRFFGNGIGIGFDAVVGFEALKLKWLTGFPSYIVAALKTIFLYYNAPLVEIEFDQGGDNKRTLMISVMNGRRMGGGFMMAPDGLNDDGFFDVCIADQVSRPRILGLIPKFMQGSQESQAEVHTHRTTRIRVTAVDGSLPAHADGETLCEAGQSLEATILPGRLEVVVAPRE
ncbi:MAG: diacylglycerol kinase family lipid kinase, partial [Anaerolineales bacterium]